MERLNRTLLNTTVLACLFSFTIIINLLASNLPAEEKPEITISYLSTRGVF